MGLLMQLIFSAALLCFIEGRRKNYEGYQVWTLFPKKQDQLDVLNQLVQLEKIDGMVARLPDKPLDVMVAPEHQEWVTQVLNIMDIAHSTKEENIQRRLDRTYHRIDQRSLTDRVYDPNDFNMLEDIHFEMDRLAEMCSEGVQCSTEILGQSTEGRDVKIFRMTKAGNNRIGHFIDAETHAREWLAGATLMRILDLMVTQYGTDSDVTYLVDTYDFYFIPIVNPDGYVFTFTDDRFWRKSRNVNPGSDCVGTDLNRNFPFQWGGEVGSDGDPCSILFRGPEAGSEPEVQIITREAERLAPTLASYISLHTWAEYWLSAYGWSDVAGVCNSPEDLTHIQQVGEAAIAAVEAVSGNNWIAGTMCEVLYEANGITSDYTYSVGIKYSYTPELRGDSFDPPPEEIEPAFQETWAGLVAMYREIEVIEGPSLF